MTAGEQEPYHARVRFFFTNSLNIDWAATVGVQLLPRLEDTRTAFCRLRSWLRRPSRHPGRYTQP